MTHVAAYQMSTVYKATDFPVAALADKPAKLAVIGYPVAHSASPQMQQPAIDEMELGISYVRVEIEPGNVSHDAAILRDAGFIGINCTVPHKFEAMAHCAELTPEAEKLGAVNTIVFRESGDLGHNTDGPGFANAILESFGVEFASLKVCILGAGGGAGQAIATQAAMLGCPEIVLANRSIEKVEALADLLSPDSQSRITPVALDSPDLITLAGGADLIVNATSLGLKPDDPSPLPAGILRPDHLVYDTIYNPAETQLLADAKAIGARTDNGLSMLLHQGALSLELWTGQKPNLEAMRNGLSSR